MGGGDMEKQRVSGHYLCPSVLFSCYGVLNVILEYCRNSLYTPLHELLLGLIQIDFDS